MAIYGGGGEVCKTVVLFSCPSAMVLFSFAKLKVWEIIAGQFRRIGNEKTAFRSIEMFE